MEAESILKKQIAEIANHLYFLENMDVKLEKTNADFIGDYTFVVFPLVRFSKKSPEITAQEIGDEIIHCHIVESYNIVKGFLNIVLKDYFWIEYLNNFNPSINEKKNVNVMVEYSSPNTNKPLHLGHLRNITLGYSVSQILKRDGFQVTETNLINDRGIHICKSMLAWQRWGNEETPESAGMKGDHLVGKYYVTFDKYLRDEVKDLLSKAENNEPIVEYLDVLIQSKLLAFKSEIEAGKKQKLWEEIGEIIKNNCPLMQDCKTMLQQWEQGNLEVINLWKKMNGWVYDGFNKTYERLGVHFDKIYYESNTYTLGKDIIELGLENNVFYKKDDGSVWIDLTGDGLDHKLVLRSDGTSVYITQDIGTAELKFDDFAISKSIYVVGNEQDYHFKVLKLIMQKLQKSYADGMYHLSYGMVDLADGGKMKSREGTVVDADNLMDDLFADAKKITEELGKTDELNSEEKNHLFETLAQAALKFFILKVDPKKRMVFNPKESIDFHGDTGPFVLYSYARIKSIFRKIEFEKIPVANTSLHHTEKDVISIIYSYKNTIHEAAETYSPAAVCQYVLDLAKAFNRMYNELSILQETDANKKQMRLNICAQTADIISTSLGLLGIKTVDRM